MKVPKKPEINIGMVGHVDHGKTTLTKTLSGEWTDKHSEEIKRGISIKLGYADTAFYKCEKCNVPECYSINKKCKHCGGKTELQRVVSFVDSPGHETLMAIMISGAAIMDGAVLVIAANEKCPQPQTKEHLMALDITGIKNLVIVQNKIDLIEEDEARENYEQIKNFVKGTVAENAPIIPISAHHDANIDVLIKTIEENITTPERNVKLDSLMYIARSFDVNKPGMKANELYGGVLGGSLVQGTVKIDDEVEIRPGRKVDVRGKTVYEPILTKVTGLIAGGKQKKKITPGGLIAIGTALDPALTKADGAAGKVIGKVGTLPPLWHSIKLDIRLLERVVGSSDELEVQEVKKSEPLLLNIGTATTVGIVTSAFSGKAEVNLKIPICAEIGQRVAISRRIKQRFRLIGFGVIENSES